MFVFVFMLGKMRQCNTRKRSKSRSKRIKSITNETQDRISTMATNHGALCAVLCKENKLLLLAAIVLLPLGERENWKMGGTIRGS